MESRYQLWLLENYWEAYKSFIAFICQQNQLHFQDKNCFRGLKMADSITKLYSTLSFELAFKLGISFTPPDDHFSVSFTLKYN